MYCFNKAMNEFYETINNRISGYIIFYAEKSEIRIIDIVVHEKSSHTHTGTNLIINLISALNLTPSRITGLLSWVDAENKNWLGSIPFYYDLPKYIYQSLKLKYEFHLFNDSNITNEVTLSDNNKTRMEQIKDFQTQHLQPHKSASFCYVLVSE